jgi:hypothetical protein
MRHHMSTDYDDRNGNLDDPEDEKNNDEADKDDPEVAGGTFYGGIFIIGDDGSDD